MLARRARSFLRGAPPAKCLARFSTQASATPRPDTLLLSNVNSTQDVEDLALFKVAKPESVRPIAVVKVGGEVITKEPEVLTRSLRFLRDQGLQPVVVHGGGPQLNDELAKAGVEPQYIGGHRVTDAATMAVARRVFESANADLAAALRAGGLDAAPVLGGVFMAEVHDPQLGLVGQITAVRQEQVEAALAAGRVPVLTSLGLSGAGQTLNINADVAARELAIALKPMRVVYISAGGGWKEEGRVVSEVNMAADYEVWVARDYTGRQGTLLKLKEMKAIVDNLPPAASVTIASAAALASQLLPHRGPGSQIRRGVKLLRFDSVGAADGVRLRALLQAAGCRAGVALLDSASSPAAAAAGAGAGPASDAAGVPAPHASHITRIIATEDYSAAAIVTQPRGGPVPLPPVLHTLALAPAAYWEGSERALWSQLDREFPAGIAWYAPAPAASPADAAAAVARDGPASVPLHFPALSSRRSSAAATAGVALSPAAGSAAAGAQVAAPATLAAGPSVFYRAAAAASPSAQDLSAIAAGVARYAGPSAAPAAAGASVRPVLPAAASVSPAGPAKEGSPLRVGLLGARGYVGRELVRLIAGHPNLQITVASSRAFKGQDVLTALGVPDAAGAVVPGLTMSDVGPEQLRAGKAPEVDAWVLALPNGLCAEHAAAIDAAYASSGRAAAAPLLVDLSADMRFDRSGQWTYGLPERPGARELLRRARKIANPGCYATGAQAALMPLLPEYNADAAASGLSWDLAHKPHIFGVSGYSGAGTNPSDKNDPDRLRDNLLPYALVNHIHEREVGHHCGGISVAFMPHVAPFFQGISLTVTGHLAAAKAGKAAAITPAAIRERYSRFYAGERLMRVLQGDKDMPDVASHGTRQHGVTVGGFTYDPATGRLALVSCIDNLLKGAATQAVQNMNLALGLPEYAGIPALSPAAH